MKFEILEQKDNRLLNRKDFIVKINEVNITPKRQEVLKSFAAKQGMDEKKLVVDKISSESGIKDVVVYFKYYDDVNSLKKIELKDNLKHYEKLNPKPEEKKKEAKEDKKESDA
jgi:ribosomal protein S24E